LSLASTNSDNLSKILSKVFLSGYGSSDLNIFSLGVLSSLPDINN